ncbi:uncharacterized protein VTP21DRAFT_1475 [Calcarisporiella thermophila]|uniref:uncharacterized protein n=1 Tax=Calcarisporiella thermophila TaxID=911321 RepID=UPI0037446209
MSYSSSDHPPPTIVGSPALNIPHRRGSVSQLDPQSAADNFSQRLSTSINSWASSYSRSVNYKFNELVADSSSERIDPYDAVSVYSTTYSPFAEQSPLLRAKRGSVASGIPGFEESIPQRRDSLARWDSLQNRAESTQDNADQEGQVYQDGAYHGLSSVSQSVFNSINVLMGIGILALPLGFRFAGWILGTLIFIFCCAVTRYTAISISRCMDSAPNVNTYADMGVVAFGPSSRSFTTVTFMLELMAAAVSQVILIGDSLKILFPHMSLTTLKLIGFAIIAPSTWLPIHILSYWSLVGIVSAFCLVGVVLIDGLSKGEAPGSLLSPMPTTLWPENWLSLPFSFGLIMAGFAGHAVFPSIYREMKNPKRFGTVVDRTYLATASIYFTMAASGYLMFGRETMEEITKNLMATDGYMGWINHIAVWLIVVNPMSKFALTMNPISLTFELMFFRSQYAIDHWNFIRKWHFPLQMTIRTLLVSVVVFIAIAIPGFDRVMALLGSFFSFAIAAIFPLACRLRIFGHSMSNREKMVDVMLIAMSTILALFGTIWSFLPESVLKY